MPIRIVNNKKLEMTADESLMFDQICHSYDEGNTKGSDLFTDLFESDNDGIILFLRPPSKRATTLEVYLFLASLMMQQHLRIMYKEVDSVCGQMKNKMLELDDKLAKLENKSA